MIGRLRCWMGWHTYYDYRNWLSDLDGFLLPGLKTSIRCERCGAEKCRE